MILYSEKYLFFFFFFDNSENYYLCFNYLKKIYPIQLIQGPNLIF